VEATQKLLSVFDINGTVVSEIEILPIWLTTGINAQIIHDCVVSELSNARQISGKTLTRGLVSGGGRKP
jgi:ribosomal protein L4